MYYSECIDRILTVFPITIYIYILHIITVEFAGGHIVHAWPEIPVIIYSTSTQIYIYFEVRVMNYLFNTRGTESLQSILR